MREIKTSSNGSIFSEDIKQTLHASGIDFEYQTCTNSFNFYKSEPSNLLYIDPIPSPEEEATIYPSNYEPFSFHKFPKIIQTARNFVQKNKAKALRRELGDNAKILDLGCGNGALLIILRQFGPKEWELHGIDPYSNLDHLSEEKISAHPINIEALDLESYFDAIILNQTIEHFRDVPNILRNVHRLLKPGGKIIIETPNTNGLDAKLFKLRYWGGYHFPRHFFLFNPSNLTELLHQNGFKTLDVEFLASPAFWIQSLHHIAFDNGSTFFAKFFTIKNISLLALFTIIDLTLIKMGLETSNQRVIARKEA